MTNNIDRAAQLFYSEGCGSRATAYYVARDLADAGLLMPDIPDGLNLIGFERKGGGGGLIWDDSITTEALTKGYAAMFARILEGEA